MEKATLIKLRELAYKATMTLYNKNKDCPEDKRTMVVRCPLNIVCDNSLNITDDPINHNVIWDDANGILYDIAQSNDIYNTSPRDNKTVLTFGVDYNSIQALEAACYPTEDIPNVMSYIILINYLRLINVI